MFTPEEKEKALKLYEMVKSVWIIVNKVDKKSERVKKFSFKIIRGKKINGRMRTLGIVKSVNVLEQGKL